MPTILVVEDEGLIAMDICMALREMGYDVLPPVHSGEEAVRVATEARPALVLMDVHLAGVTDGIEAAIILRTRLDIPVVYLTSHADDATMTRAFQAMPYGYLLKPFRERELELAIRVALQRYEAEAAAPRSGHAPLAAASAEPSGGGRPDATPETPAWHRKTGGARLLELITVRPDSTGGETFRRAESLQAPEGPVISIDTIDESDEAANGPRERVTVKP